LSQPNESVDLIYCDILYGTGRNFYDYQDLKPIRSEIENHYLPRLIEMKRVNAKAYKDPKPRVFLAQLGELAKKKSLRIFSELEKSGVLVAESFGRGSLKSQLRTADRMGVEVTLIIGQKEALDGTVIVKDMVSSNQETVTNEKLPDAVKKILKSNVIVSKK